MCSYKRTRNILRILSILRRILRKSIPDFDKLPQIEDVFEFNNLKRTYFQLEKYAGQAPGVDGKTWKMLSSCEINELCANIRKSILDRNFCRDPVRTTQIPKATRGKRTLSIGTIRDRLIAACLSNALCEYLDRRMLPVSYGYRLQKSLEHLLKELESYINATQCYVLAKADIKDAFGPVNKQSVLDLLKNWEVPDEYLWVIEQMLKNNSVAVGIEQGNSLSPLLLNVLLTEILDRHFFNPSPSQPNHPEERLEEHSEETVNSCRYFRYADDLLFCLTDPTQATVEINRTKQYLIETGMVIKDRSVNKTDIRQRNIDYLGFTLNWREKLEITPSKQSFKELERKIKEKATNSEYPEKDILYTIQGWIAAKRIGLGSQGSVTRTINIIHKTLSICGFNEILNQFDLNTFINKQVTMVNA